jgi:NADP-dependent 3-hydroxy acid dehydrogenase YdfG
VATAGVAVVTGASAGIGAATVRVLAAEGYRVVGGARRLEVLTEVCGQVGALALPLDLTDEKSIEQFVARAAEQFGHIDLLVNNAGTAIGQDPIAIGHDDDWIQMLNTNVLGLLRITRAALPMLRRAPRAHIVNVTSTSAFEVYPGGGCYTATKHAERAISRTLRLELLGEPIRITEIAPGLTATDFYNARFHGDLERVRKVFEGIEPLLSEEVAECIRWAVSQPPNVNVDEIVVRPLAQATAMAMRRASS